MAEQETGIFGTERNSFSLKEQLARYVQKWPLFLISLVFCVGCGILYTRYAVPKYIANTSFLVKGSENVAAGPGDLIDEALNGKSNTNLNNDILLIGSLKLMERTVSRNNFNISYYLKGRLLNSDVYKDCPFTLIPLKVDSSSNTVYIYIAEINKDGGSFSLSKEKESKKDRFRWNVPFTITGHTFVIRPKGKVQTGSGEYIVLWQPVKDAAGGLLKELAIRPFDPKTSVIQLTLKTSNLQRGLDVLNALFSEFNLSNIEARNKISESTVRFIDDRLLKISSELQGVEGNLENYQGANQVIDLKSQSSKSLENIDEVSKTLKRLSVQQRIVKMIFDYFENPANNNKLVPSSLGLEDETLASLIVRYNELQLKKERETPLVAANSTVMQDLNEQLGNLKGSILESLNNISKNFQLQESSLQSQNSSYRSTLSSVPHNERVLQEIKRQQGITEGLYLYLLQKREETAISGTSSSVPRYEQIDSATGFGPVEPNSRNILLCTVLLGLFIPFAYIYIRALLNDKISSKKDIVSHTSLPLLGQIAHIPKENKQSFFILDRNIIGEQFRAIRTNLSFLLKRKTTNVILVTSSVSGEGKSFVSLNLAASFALPGKKVALLEFDIRHPVIARNLKVNSPQGISDYLIGDVNTLAQIRRNVADIPGLHLYTSGPLPPNPGDLLLSETMSHLFDSLKTEYDYIVIDSPPAGLVSDPFILGGYSDVVLYIIRSQKTLKKHIDFISNAVTDKTLNQVALILNDVKKGDDYGYGYGSDSNYGDYNKTT